MNWHRSLYWRIALGVVGFLAAMLAAQAMLFVWVVAQSGRTLPGQSPARFAQMIAQDAGDALERDPELDLGHYLNEQYAQYTHPFFVMLADNRVIAIGDAPIDSWVQATRALLRRRLAGHGDPHSPDVRGRDHQARPGRANVVSPLERDDPEAAVLGFQPMAFVVNGRVAGMVVVPPRAPFAFLLTRFAPMLSLVAAAVLIVGSRVHLGADLRAAPAPAAWTGAGRAESRRRRPVRACARNGRRRNRRGRDRLQRDGGGPLRPGPGARDLGPHAATAAGGRLARAQHAGHRDARLPRNAHDAGSRPGRGDARALSRRSSGTKRPASNGSSATCSTWRDSRVAAER